MRKNPPMKTIHNVNVDLLRVKKAFRLRKIMLGQRITLVLPSLRLFHPLTALDNIETCRHPLVGQPGTHAPPGGSTSRLQ